MSVRSVLALSALLWVGCGSGSTPSTSPDASAQPRGAYPAGPYGTAEGALIEPLAFTLSDGTPRTLEDVWSNESNRLLLLVTASGWCTSCREHQPQLESLHDEWAPKGLAVMEAIFETSDFQPADVALASSWKRQYALTFDVVADPTFLLGRYYDRMVTPMTMLVDVGEMKILRITTGSDPSATEALIQARLQ